MSIILSLRAQPEGHLTPFLNGQPFVAPTPLDKLPTLDRLQADPFELGKALTAALGGEPLVRKLEADGEGPLFLDCDECANKIAGDFAATPDRRFLAVRFGLLRLIGDRDAPPPPASSELRFIALAADPLVDDK